jgi:hypothetical protein
MLQSLQSLNYNKLNNAENQVAQSPLDLMELQAVRTDQQSP